VPGCNGYRPAQIASSACHSHDIRVSKVSRPTAQLARKSYPQLDQFAGSRPALAYWSHLFFRPVGFLSSRELLWAGRIGYNLRTGA
jgi:hypothetical protein